MNKFSARLGVLRERRTLLLNLVRLMLVLFVIVALITVFMYGNARSILQKELLSANENTASNMARSLDDLLSEMRYVTAAIGTSEMVQFYFSDTSPTAVFGSFHERIRQQLHSFTYGLSYIHSIYLYAPERGRYITTDTGEPMEKSAESGMDRGWLEEYGRMTERIAVFPRKIADIYPYVITIINRVIINDVEGVVVLNLNLRRLPNILDQGVDSQSQLYIIDNDSQLIYRKNQVSLFEGIGDFPELNSFEPNLAMKSAFVSNGDNPFVYTQAASREYDWNYVTVTYLKEYTGSLSSQRAMLMGFLAIALVCVCAVAIFFSMSFYRPIGSIVDLLENPDSWEDSDRGNEKDIRGIAEKIVSHIQTSNRLSSELQSQLDILNATRIWAFQSQINPHFLYNTLNFIHLSIVEALGHKHIASEMVVHLGKILRFALEPESLVTIRSELIYTEHFLAIISARFNDQIDVDIRIEEEAARALIPKLILQPLIENAFSHGMRENKQICIRVTAVRKPVFYKKAELDSVVLTIEDDGVGIEEGRLAVIRQSLNNVNEQSEDHIGMKNVATRLKLLFGEEHALEVENGEMGGAKITLTFPCRRE